MIRNEFEDNQIYKTVESSLPPVLNSLRDKSKFCGSGFNNSNDESQHCDTFNAEHNNSIRDLQPLDSISLNKNIIKNLEEDLKVEFKVKEENACPQDLPDEESKSNSAPEISRNQLANICVGETFEKQSDEQEKNDQTSVIQRKIRKNGFECPINCNLLFTYTFTVIEIITIAVILAPFIISLLGGIISIITLCLLGVVYSLQIFVGILCIMK